MAVVSAIKIINILDNSSLISDNYKDKLGNDISSLIFMNAFTSEEELNDTIENIKLCTASKIENRSDLIALTTKAEDVKKLSDTISEFDCSLVLPTFRDIKTNPKEIIKKLHWCKEHEYPLCDEQTGIIYKEICDTLAGKDYLRSYYIENNIHLDIDNENKLRNLDLNKYNALLSSLERFSSICFKRIIPRFNNNFDNYIISLVNNNEEISYDEFILNSLTLLKENNSFIDVDYAREIVEEQNSYESNQQSRTGQR